MCFVTNLLEVLTALPASSVIINMIVSIASFFIILVERALKIGNYTELYGQEIYLTRFEAGGVKEMAAWNIFATNLAPDVKTRDLHNLLAKYGKIFSCRVKYDNIGQCKGFGFVQFEKKDDAQRALLDGKGLELKGQKIDLIFSRGRQNREENPNSESNLFVRGIPKRYTNDDLHNLFAPYGELLSAIVIKDRPDSAENKGFGFVCFKEAEDMHKAEQSLNKQTIEGQDIFVSLALSREGMKKQMQEERLKMYKDCNVYVKPLPEDVTDQTLKAAFEQFAPVISARVMMERNYNPVTNQMHYKSMGFGFVCFATQEGAKKAIEAAEKTPIFGIQLYVAIAQKKEERTAKYGAVQTFDYFQQNPMQMYPMPFYGGQPGPRYRRPRNVDKITYN